MNQPADHCSGLAVGPLAAATLWYYQGTYQRTQPVATPDTFLYITSTADFNSDACAATVNSRKTSGAF